MDTRVAADVVVFCTTKSEALAARSVQIEPSKRINCGQTPATLARLGDLNCLTLAAGAGVSRQRQAFDSVLRTCTPRLFVAFGAASAIDPTLRIGAATIAREIVAYFVPRIQADEKVISCDVAALERAGFDAVFTRAGSWAGDIRDAALRDRIGQQLAIQTTDWESYRLAERCETARIAFLALRAVTDRADAQAGIDYGRHADGALRKAAALLPELARRMCRAGPGGQ